MRKHLSNNTEQATDTCCTVKEFPNDDTPAKQARCKDHMYYCSIYMRCLEKANLYKGKPGLRVGTEISHKWAEEVI